MKPPPFGYVRATTVEEAVATLAQHGGDAKVIAGGQSLMPMLNFRLLRPSVLVDIGRIPGLATLEETPDRGLRIGALTRHHTLETSPVVKRLFPVISEAMRHVAHLAIRNRGTIGGSLAHADPAAELPMMAVLLGAEIVTQSPSGKRVIPAMEFFLGSLTTALAEDELVVRVDVPGLPAGCGWGFEEFARRAGDYALAAVAVVLDAPGGKIRKARIAMMGVGETPLRRPDAEVLLAGRTLDNALIRDVVRVACGPLAPNTDLAASAEYRKHLAAVLTERVLRAAWKRASGETL